MPGLAQTNDDFSNGPSPVYSISTNGFWSKHRVDFSYNQLQKFWRELSPQARQELLRIDKQALFEQARKNMYCSRCNGLLLEGFLQIVMYGKSLQQEGAGSHIASNRIEILKNQKEIGSRVANEDELQDPSVHPWGGLSTARDGSLTLMDCYLYSKSLKGLQTVFDSARARERERELLYPDACGGGARGWISQGLVSNGRGHGTRETCALHTARLSCDTLMDFWSALGEETRKSLLRMKEEDFIERLMYRFDSKRFCRDCRRNVIREFKELKELKRMRREPHCTSWFCAADTAFQYEVSYDSIQADWRQAFADSMGLYHHFEWAAGTREGKCDILEFENVRMNGNVQVNGLDLGSLGACFITLRAIKSDGRCTEISVKAHALKGQQCVHSRLVVGDGYVTITKGESIRSFFEHAEEAEEDEDDESIDKDGNELDGECFRPQKHAKSPELAREFLLDAATVIFKEQVEKAFREGTARQNAHSIFVCLALKLLEERVHVACKEIITFEMQMKLLEEEEKEKREEENRKERRRTKEREKKLRRKERLKGKDKDKEKKMSESSEIPCSPKISKEDRSTTVDEDQNNPSSCENSVEEVADVNSYGNQDEVPMTAQSHSYDAFAGESTHEKDEAGNFEVEKSRFSARKLKYSKEAQLDMSLTCSDRRRCGVSENDPVSNRSGSRHYDDGFLYFPRGINGSSKSRHNSLKSNCRNCGSKFYCSGSRTIDRYDSHTCSGNQDNEYRVRVEPYSFFTGNIREPKTVNKSEFVVDASKQFYGGCKYNQVDYKYEGCGRTKSRVLGYNHSRDQLYSRKAWEPLESQKKCHSSNSDSDVTLRSAGFKVGSGYDNDAMNLAGNICLGASGDSGENNLSNDLQGSYGTHGSFQCHPEAEGSCVSTEVTSTKSCALNGAAVPTLSSTANSGNCSPSLSEGDSNTTSNCRNTESSSTSDSEDASQQSEALESSAGIGNAFSECHELGTYGIQKTNRMEEAKEIRISDGPSFGGGVLGHPSITVSPNIDDGTCGTHKTIIPPMPTQSIQFPMFQAPSTMGYYQQNPVSWPAALTKGLMSFPHPNHYMYAGPLGYGLNDNSHFCVRYGGLQHLATPVFNPAAVPVYQPVVKNVEEQSTGFQPSSRQEHKNGVALFSNEVYSNKKVSNGEDGEKNHSAKPHTNNSNFSLFHFGGPVALSSAGAINSPSTKGGTDGYLTSKNSADDLETNHDCNKKETTVMEEYSLFAASDRLKFFNFLN